MKLSEIAVNKQITAIMLFIGIVVLGMVSYSKLPVDLYPDIEYPMAMIVTEYPNVGSREVESTVTRPIEESVSAINNIDEVMSTSAEGVSMVTVKFTWGTNMGTGTSDIREKLDLIKQYFPDEVGTPLVFKFDVSMMAVLMISVTGEKNIGSLREYAEDHLKNRFEQVEGVATADVIGGYLEEIHVDLFKNRIDAYGLSIDAIASKLMMENLNVSGGDVKSDIRKYTIRTQGEYKTLDDIRNVIVSVKNKTPIYLKDVARVYKGPEEKKQIVRLNGKDGVMMMLRKQSDKNTVLVARNALKRVAEIEKTLPPGMKLTVFFNQAEFIEQAISNLVDSALQGGLIAVFVVFVFLRNFRAALILGLSIPLSIIMTFAAMYYFNLSVNMMSLGGLALGVGMLIDNSIVVLENVFRFRERGARATEAAKLGASEMGMAITASTLTTIVVFIPFLFTEGLASQLFKDMALTITFSLLASLLVALTLVPMMTARYIKDIHVQKTRFKWVTMLLDWTESSLVRLEKFYGKVIRWALGHRKQVVLYTAGAVVFGLLLIPVAGMEFMPEQDQNRIVFYMQLPVGTNIETSEATAKLAEKKINETLKPGEVLGINIRAGQGTGLSAILADTKDHQIRIDMRLAKQSARKRSEREIRDALRAALRDLPGVTLNFSKGQGVGGMGIGGTQISVEVYGYDLDDAKKYTKEIYDAIKKIDGVKDAEISREEGLPEKTIIINREKASPMGLNALTLANIVKYSVAGKKATTYRYEGKEYDVVVRYRDEDRKSIDDIMGINVMNTMGKSIPISNVIDVKTTSGPTGIERKKQERVVYINCKAEGRALNKVAEDINSEIRKIVAPKNFRTDISGAFKDMGESFIQLGLALALAILLIYIIMASQFESLWAPFIIMFTVPTMMFGVSIFLFLTGTTFNVITFMGVLMLAGIVVNNGIVYLDYTNILVARGLTLHEALVQAGTLRLRPILMTTFTTIFGLIPMAIGLGEGAEMSTPLARAVMGGLSSSFIFTLVFLPVIYTLMEDLKNKYYARKRRRTNPYA